MSRTTAGRQGTNRFSEIPRAEIQRSAFDRSCNMKTTFDAGKLIPIFCDEILPGDTMALSFSHFARLATPIKPVMDNLYLDVFFFFVPNRLVWSNWVRLNGQQDSPGDSVDFVTPKMSSPVSTGYTSGSLSDHLGIPIKVPELEHMSLFHRAYALICDEWFRDENLIDTYIPSGMKDYDGPDDPADYPIRSRGKRRDYFTSCLPWPQKGDPVTIGLGTTAPVIGDGNPMQLIDTGSAPFATGINVVGVGADLQTAIGIGGTNIAAFPDSTGLVADLANAEAATVNQLREAFQFQKLLERDARAGTRYTEVLRAHFGVVSEDQRLQRPEYLSGGSFPISINSVPQTSSTAALGTDTPQGSLAAFGTTGSSGGSRFNRSFTEHGMVIGLACVRADLNYQQGLPRMFSRSTRYDYYWPAFAQLGEQAVLNKEIYAQGSVDPDADASVFGYQERWSEYRYKPNLITGKFRSTVTAPLDVWHLAQEFDSLPVLNETFISEDVPIDRVIAVTSEPHLLFDAAFGIRHVRPMPTYSVPGMIDHF